MRKRQFYWSALGLVGLIAGCKPATTTLPATQPTMTADASKGHVGHKKTAGQEQWELPDTDKPLLAEQHPKPKDDAEALAQATNDYARAVQMLLNKHNAAAGTNPAGADPSQVHFGDAPNKDHSPDAAANTGGAAPAGANLPGAGRDINASQREQFASAPNNPIPNPSVTQTPAAHPEMSTLNKDSPAVNTPLPFGQPRLLPATDDMAQRLAKQVKDYPQDVSAQLDWQLLQLLQGQTVGSTQSMAGLSSEDREMLSAIMDGLTNFRNAMRADNNMLLSRKIRPMLETADRLRTQAELSIPVVALCTDVKGFGVYEPLEPARFPADNKEHRVIVYCEVENFASQLDNQKRWETKLSQDVVLYTEQNGLEVWRDKTPVRPIVDYSRNRRHDFFIVKMVRLPANLTIGRYLLKVTVTDEQVNRVAENTVAVQIVAN